MTQPAGRCCRVCSNAEWELCSESLGRSSLGDAQHMLPIEASGSPSLSTGSARSLHLIPEENLHGQAH